MHLRGPTGLLLSLCSAASCGGLAHAVLRALLRASAPPSQEASLQA